MRMRLMRREFFLLPNANETHRYAKWNERTAEGKRRKQRAQANAENSIRQFLRGMPAPKGFCIRLFVTKKAVRNSSLLRTNPDRQTALWIYLFRTYILTVQRKQLSCWSCNHSHYVHMKSVSLLTSILANRCDVFGGIRVFLICSVASELPLVTTLLPFAFTIPLLSASDYSEVHLLLQNQH